MMLAWLGWDQIAIVIFAFALPALFLYIIRNALRRQEERERRNPPAPAQEPH